MAYFIFDMDQTLADPLPAFYFIDSIAPKNAKNSTYFANFAAPTYNKFVQNILSEETSTTPLGILRPGILPVMSRLNGLQEKGKLKSVIIYSNNGHLETLHFIRDLIHLYVGSNILISECIHWHHPMRDSERIVKPGVPNKTWKVLKNIMVEGNCQAPDSIEPKDVYFFDDLDHPDLQYNLGANYYKVPAYTFKASVDRIAGIYKDSVSDINFKDYVSILNDNKYKVHNKPNIDNIIQIFKNKTTKTATEMDSVPLPDIGIDIIDYAIRAVDTHSSKSGGLRHKTYKRKRKYCSLFCSKCNRNRKGSRRKTVKKIEMHIK
jgi:hypothetical protein